MEAGSLISLPRELTCSERFFRMRAVSGTAAIKHSALRFSGDEKIRRPPGSKSRSPFLSATINLSLACFLIFLAGSWSGLFANAGDLDLSFDTDGKVITDISGGTDQVSGIAVQPDGKIVAAGVSFADFVVARYNPDGSLDTGFGTNGVVTYDFDGFPDRARAIALQQDGKIVVVGESNVNSAQNFGLVRYNADGTLDAGFGTGGSVFTDFAGNNDYAYAVAIQPDGKIIVAGDVGIGGLFYFGLARYNSNGSLDGTFGTGGKTFNLPNGSANSLAIQSNGKIVAAGTVSTGGSDPDFAVARYNSDGSLDTTFNGTGEVTTNFSGTSDSLAGLALQSNGKIIVAGSALINGTTDFALIRYNSDGSLDTAFGTNGKVSTDFALQADSATSVEVQADGKIVAAGLATISTDPGDSAIARYNPDGTLDAGFGANGKVTIDFASSYDTASDIAIQADGKIVIAGTATAPSYAFTLARLEGGSSPPPACLFCDDFENGILAPNWTYTKPSWNETGGNLIGAPAGGKAETLASPVFSAGCSLCTVETAIRTAGGLQNSIWLFAWYKDKANFVELIMKEEKDRWILKQHSAGAVVAKAKGVAPILPNVFYSVKISYDGAKFTLTVDGAVLATTVAGAAPNGTVGYRVKRTTGSFAFIQVH